MLPGYVDPGILIDQETMESLSKYFDTTLQIEKYFDCKRVEGDFQAYACPVALITGFSSVMTSDTIIELPFNYFHTAGTDNPLLLITGVCFDSIRGNSYVEFTNAKRGPNQDEWVKALDGDYVTWSNEEILMHIPSIGLDTPSSWYAGTGPVRVHIDGVGTSTSSTDLVVQYALKNNTYPGHEATVPDHSLFQNLNDMNGNGGYSLYYDSNFTDTIYAEGAPAAFERALLKWQCETEVNFIMHDTIEWVGDTIMQNLACMIKFDTLPYGTSTTLARTSLAPNSCITGGEIYTYSRTKKFDISFNSNLAWYTEIDTTFDPGLFGRKDLESRALHELGHAQSVLHSNNPEDLMFWTDASPPTYYNRDIMLNDYNAANRAILLSEEPITCNLSSFVNIAPYLLEECSPPVNISEESIRTGVQIFPNPTSDYFTINLSNKNEIISYQLYNAIGKLIKAKSIISNEKVSLLNESRGIYFLKINGKNIESSVIKIIKE